MAQTKVGRAFLLGYESHTQKAEAKCCLNSPQRQNKTFKHQNAGFNGKLTPQTIKVNPETLSEKLERTEESHHVRNPTFLSESVNTHWVLSARHAGKPHNRHSCQSTRSVALYTTPAGWSFCLLLLSCSGFPPSSISHYRGDDTKARLIPSPLRRFMASRGAAATMTQGRPAMKSCGQRMNQEVSQSPELRHRKTSGGGRDTKENTTPHFCNKSSDHCIQDLSTQIKKAWRGDF